MLSIIIPAYNAAKTIQECLESILVEKNIPFEIIVVDDGSTDTTSDLVKMISGQDKRVRLISQENAGVSVARNIGIRQAKGDYIMFVDADDKLDYDWGNIRNLVGTNDVCIFSEKINNKISERELLKIIAGYQHSKVLLSGPFSKVFRRKFLLDNRIDFNEKIINGEDMLFNIEAVSKASVIGKINFTFYNYRVGHNSATKRYNKQMILSDKEFHKELYELTKNLEGFESVREYNLQMAIITIAQRLAFAETYDEVKGEYKELEQSPYREAFGKKCLLDRKAKIIFVMLKFRRYLLAYRMISYYFRKQYKDENMEKFERI